MLERRDIDSKTVEASKFASILLTENVEAVRGFHISMDDGTFWYGDLLFKPSHVLTIVAAQLLDDR